MFLILLSDSLLYAQKLTNAHQFVGAIDSSDLQFIVSALASEKMVGRKTGEYGQQLAAQFVTRQFERLELEALDEFQDYLQPFSLVKSEPDHHRIIVNNIPLERDKDYVFLGELNTNEQLGANLLDARKKDSEALVPAIGSEVLILTDHEDIHLTIEDLRSKGYKTFVVLMESEKYKGLNINQRISGERGEYLRFENEAGNEFGIFYMDESRWDEIIGSNSSFEDTNASFEVTRREELVQTENVLACIGGEGLENEWLVISAHYDHLGIKDGEIMYGADDNATGVAAMLEIAQALKEASKAGFKPRRSVLFVAFTGEEQGLLGSEFFANSEVFDQLDIRHNLNIDMLGRMSPEYEGYEDYIYLIGSNLLSTQLHELSEAANSAYSNLTLDYTFNDINHPLKVYQRSDQWSFVRQGVSSIFYFGGVHDDYHRQTDTADKINYNVLKNRSSLIFHTALTLLNQ